MINETFLLLFFLQIKHWYIDFVNQSDAEVKGKAIYGNRVGIMHSLKHGVGTAICLLAIAGFEYFPFAIILGIIDGVAHYHIDWAKMNWGNRDITTPAFWAHLGLDQMAHQICYLCITWLVMV
jgi:hypothetical protein